jgi:hypothetical protein
MFVPCSLHFQYIFICGFTPSVRKFIGQDLSLGARRAAQAERRSAITAKVPASEAAGAAAAASTAAAAANERALSASPPLFALSPTAKIDSITSPPTGASADGPSPASIAGSLTGSLALLVYVEDFYRKHNRSVRALVVMCHCLMHDDGTPAIDVFAAPWLTMKKSVVRVSLKEYQSEITRRWDIMCAYDPDLKANSRDIPHPSQQKLAKLQMWLDNNLVIDDGECAFLLDAVDERICASARAEAEKAVVSALFNKKWVGKEPILRLIHSCMR